VTSDEEHAAIKAMFSGQPMQNEATPGYHVVFVGGGPIGQPLSLCPHCGALLANTDEVRATHTQFHKGLSQIAQWVMAQDPDIE